MSEQKSKVAKKNGRPTIYTDELALRLCARISTTRDSLIQILNDDPEFPSPDTVYTWKISNKNFSDMFDDAKRIQAEWSMMNIHEHEKNVEKNHTIHDKDGNIKLDPAAVALAKLKADNDRWAASRLVPRLYGDKSETKVTITSHEDVLKQIREMMQ